MNSPVSVKAVRRKGWGPVADPREDEGDASPTGTHSEVQNWKKKFWGRGRAPSQTPSP